MLSPDVPRCPLAMYSQALSSEPPVCLTDRCPRGQNPPTHIHTGGTSPNLQVDLLKCLPNQSACLAAHSPALGEATPLLPRRSRSRQPCPPLPLSGPRAFQGIYKILALFCSVCAQPLSHVRLFVTPRTVAPLSMEFSRQEYWSRLPFPTPGDLPHPEIEPESLASPSLAGGFFTASATWEAPLLFKALSIAALRMVHITVATSIHPPQGSLWN